MFQEGKFLSLDLSQYTEVDHTILGEDFEGETEGWRDFSFFCFLSILFALHNSQQESQRGGEENEANNIKAEK